MKQKIGSFWRALRARPLLVVLGAVAVLVLGWWLFFSNGEPILETMVVTRGEFVQQVSVSGKVVAAQEVDLAFSESGRVEALNVKVGDTVRAGQTLATLAISVLASDLRTAEADVQKVRGQQDALVASAYRTLLSTALSAVPDISTYTVTPPVISGLYNGAEGTYRFAIDRRSVNTNDYDLRTFNLERTGPTLIAKDEPTALGTHGLYVAFPDDIKDYQDTIWNITIPNNKSTSYLANYNAYQEALRARDRATATAEADIERIRTDIAERVLRAPFAGVVTVVDTEVGATAAVNAPVVSLIGDQTLQIESFVPEINLALVKPGASSTVTLDAYGAQVPFEAVVVSVDPAETVRDGVSTYRAILEFVTPDERVRSGMTANVVIVADRRDNVISVPQRAITLREGARYVRVKEGETVVEREVTTGAVSSVGSTEIVSGLEEGETIVLAAE